MESKSSDEPEAPAHAQTPSPRPTTAEDRAGFQNNPAPQGSNIARARAYRGSDLDPAALRAALPPHLVEAIVRVFDSLVGPLRSEALRGLDLLLSQPDPVRHVVAVMMARPARKLTPADIARFRASGLAGQEVAEGLAHLHRLHECLHVGAYLPDGLRHAVVDALVDHPNQKEAKLAIDWIIRMTPRQNRALYVLERLRRTGVLEDGESGPKFVPEQDIVASLAAAFKEGLRPTAGYIATPTQKAEAARIAEPIRGTGITNNPHWQRSNDTGRRGLLAENLRKAQIQAEIAGTPAQIAQGIIVLRVPAGLRACTTLEQATAYCEAHDIRRSTLFSAKTAQGSVYGLSITEIDLAVFTEDREGKVLFSRFENVKAGGGNAGHARKQNEKARLGLLDPEVVFLFPEGGLLRDRSADLVRTAGDALVLETVGPLDLGGYTKSYGLDSETLDLVRDALNA